MSTADTLQGFKRDGRVVIVGASLAGLRAAEALRDEGFTGKLTMIGDELGSPTTAPAVQAGTDRMGTGRRHHPATAS